MMYESSSSSSSSISSGSYHVLEKVVVKVEKTESGMNVPLARCAADSLREGEHVKAMSTVTVKSEEEYDSFPLSFNDALPSHTYFPSSLSHEQTSNQAATTTVKKKRIRKRRILPLLPMPRIPRSDIRRQYARMFSNVYNACDFDLLTQYLSQFYRPDLSVPVHAVISYASGKLKLKLKYPSLAHDRA